MGTVKISETNHEIFGKCVRIENGIAELLVAIDFGPRIIHYSLVGKRNMFYEDHEQNILGENLEVFGPDTLKLYGGHRLWASPEILPRCYYPDTNPVEYKIIENGAEFTAPVEKLNNIQKILAVSLSEDNSTVNVYHTIKNCGMWEIELAPWALTMMAPGGKEIIPMPMTPSGLLPNRFIVLWDYSAMNDPRVYWGREYITLTQNPDISGAFKLGLNNEAGWAAVFNNGQLFFKFFEPVGGGIYPDNGWCYETYVNGGMMESETLGELTILAPGCEVNHSEEWELYDEPNVPSDDEEDIKKLISKYIDF